MQVLIVPELLPWVGALLLVLSETQTGALERGDHTSPTPGMAQCADSSFLEVLEVWRIVKECVCLCTLHRRALVLTVITDKHQLIHERKRGMKHLSSGNGPHSWRWNLAAHLLESSDQNFPVSLNWMQSKHCWWHRHCTVQLQQLPSGHRDEKGCNGNYKCTVGSEYGQKLWSDEFL